MKPKGSSRPKGRATGTTRRKGFGRKKVCRFCADSALTIDYKDAQALRHFITERGKIIPRRISGNCAKHQRKVMTAVKRARNIALLPFTTMVR